VRGQRRLLHRDAALRQVADRRTAGDKPESLSRAFARLRDAGVRVRQNKAAILDVARLRDLAEEDRAAAWSRSE